METNLKRIRVEKRMTQQKLADKSGVSRVTIGLIERGECDDVKISTLKLLADALGCKPSAFLIDW